MEFIGQEQDSLGNSQELNSANSSIEELSTLDDLELVAQTEDEVKGGPGGFGSGGVLVNHNETTAEDEEAETGELDDLPIEEDEQVKGGPGGYSSGGVLINHNETAAEDEGEEAPLADLQPTEAESDEVKSGQGVTVLAWARVDGTTSVSNHNETTMEENEDEAEPLADLPVENDEQVTGGHYVGTANGGVWKTTSGN